MGVKFKKNKIIKMSTTEAATALIKQRLSQLDTNPKKNPIFEAMVKNFSQMAYINGPEKGLALFPHVLF